MSAKSVLGCLIFMLLAPFNVVATQKDVSHSQTGAPAAKTGIETVQAEKYVLPNGLQVILHVDRKLPIVHVNVCYHVGSKDEAPGRSGFAHLFEHLMFQGSKNAPGNYLGLVEKAGANLFEGGVNGNTEEDRTNYFETVPSGNLEYILWLESDRMATLADALTQKEFDNQREVVNNELQLVHQSRPYGRAATLMYSNLFPAGHPYDHHPIGSERDLAAAQLGEVKAFFKTYYTPNNATLVIAGDFDPQHAKQLVTKYFSGIPTGNLTPRTGEWVTRHHGKTIIDVSDHVAYERSYLAWSVPQFFGKGDAELDLIALILADGITSRLHKTLVDDKQLCLDVSSDHSPFEAAGMFSIAATAKSGASLPNIESAIMDQLRRLAEQGPSPAELRRAKNKWELRFFTQLERIGGFGGKADLLNKYNAFLGNPNMFAADIERHAQVTAQSVQEAVKQWLGGENILILRFHPITAHNQPETLDRSQAPPFGAEAPFHPPEVKSGKLQNGLTVLVVERHDVPKVAVAIGARAGSAFDPQGKAGLARVVVEALKRGTASRTATQVENELADVGTSLTTGVDRDYSSLSFEVLDNNLMAAMQVFADVVQHPIFAEGEVAKEKQASLSELHEMQSNGQFLAALLAPTLIFGSGHPYGHPAQGLPSGIQKIKRDDLVKFHSACWTPRSSVLVFVGDTTFSAAMAMAENYFSGWPDKQPASLSVPPPEPVDSSKVYIIDLPGAPQAIIRQVLPLPGIESPDAAAVELANGVWGGGSAARLNMNLRQDKGYAFSVFSHPFFYPKYSDWQSYGSVQVAKVRESASEFQSELENLSGRRPIAPQELESAKLGRIRGYAQQFESLGRVSQQVLRLWADGMPMSQLANEIQELQQVDLNGINAAAKKYANPKNAVLLIVGDVSKMGDLTSLYSGGVTLLDAEGNPVQKKAH